MAKRDCVLQFKCSHDGCQERATFRYSTMKERSESYEAKKGKWTCLRHSNLDRLLSASNTETVFESVSREESYGRFFGNNGLLTGPGFLAYANDFPVGTKIIVTARIELPKEQEQS